jgi:hypothetical protein
MLPRLACLLLCALPLLAQDDLPARLAAAPPLTVEDLGTPVKATRGGDVGLIPNPDGKTYDALIRYYNTYWGPHTTVIVDLGTGAVSRHARPSALYSRAALGPDGKFYSTITGEGGTAFEVYDPATNTITDLAAIAKDVEGETKPLTIGTDGLMYGAGSKGGRAIIYQLDTATGKVTDYGLVGPDHSPNACWGYTVAADDRYVYVASGKLPWYLVAYDRHTGKDSVLLTHDDPTGYLSVDQQRYGCTASVKDTKANASRRYWLHQGQAIEITAANQTAPWPEPAEQRPWYVEPPKPELGTGHLIPLADGKAELWWRPAKDAEWRHVAYEVPTYAYPVLRLLALPNGQLCGSGGNYLGVFTYDPATRTAHHPGVLGLSHYCSTVLDGKVYMSGYPNSALYVYDPAKPWTARTAANAWDKPLRDEDPNANPRWLAWLSHAGSGCHKMLAGVTANGKVYFGGRWYRNGEGGGLGWYDPATNQASGISEPFRCYQVHYLATAEGGRYVVASTAAVRDAIGNQPAPASAALLIFDTQEMKLVRQLEPVTGAAWTGPIAGVGGPWVLGLTYNPADRQLPDYQGKPALSYGHKDLSSLLYRVNVATGEIAWVKPVASPAGFLTNENAARQDGYDFQLGPDGQVWTYLGGRFANVNPEKDWHYAYVGPNLALVRIAPADGAISVVGKLDRGGEMAFVGRDLYLSGGDKYLEPQNAHLRRILQVVPAP